MGCRRVLITRFGDGRDILKSCIYHQEQRKIFINGVAKVKRIMSEMRYLQSESDLSQPL
jgi:hypothetical protein